MKKNLFLVFLLQLFIFNQCSSPDNSKNKQISITPESQGISSKAILNFIEAAEKERKDDLHSFMLLRHGKVLAQGWWLPYNQESPHMLFSLSKSFTSTAIGIAQKEGLLSIDDQVLSFFPDKAPSNPGENLKQMRIRDLLKMNTGHNADVTDKMRFDGRSWAEAFLSFPVEHKPGTHFVYNSAATYMLSAILQKVTGETLLQYLTPRLFEPLGITNPTWESNPEGINTGGWGLSIRTEDIANFGQLYLQKGNWNGKQLVPKEWVEEATSYQTSNGSDPESDWEQGYGYQFWRCRHNLYRGDGAFGQFCIVMPEQDAILAITSGTNNMQAIMNLAWDHLLPEFKENALPEDKANYVALQNKLALLALSTVEGNESSPLASSISGKNYIVEENIDSIMSVSFELAQPEKSITIAYQNGKYTIPIGFNAMKKGIIKIPQIGKQPTASCGAWISENQYKLKIYLYETPF